MSKRTKIYLGISIFVALNLIAGRIFLYPYQQLGTGYMAKQMCSCVYVAERTFDSCEIDQRRDIADWVTVRPLPELDGVHAEIWPFADDQAYYFEGYGCTLD